MHIFRMPASACVIHELETCKAIYTTARSQWPAQRLCIFPGVLPTKRLSIRALLLCQVAADVEALGAFYSAADLEPVMCVLERWTKLLEFDLFHSQDMPVGGRKTCASTVASVVSAYGLCSAHGLCLPAFSKVSKEEVEPMHGSHGSHARSWSSVYAGRYAQPRKQLWEALQGLLARVEPPAMQAGRHNDCSTI